VNNTDIKHSIASWYNRTIYEVVTHMSLWFCQIFGILSVVFQWSLPKACVGFVEWISRLSHVFHAVCGLMNQLLSLWTKRLSCDNVCFSR